MSDPEPLTDEWFRARAACLDPTEDIEDGTVGVIDWRGTADLHIRIVAAAALRWDVDHHDESTIGFLEAKADEIERGDA